MIQGGFNPDQLSLTTAVETLYAVLCQGREGDQVEMTKLHTDLAAIAGMDSGDDVDVTSVLGVSEADIERARRKANERAAAKAAESAATPDVVD